MPWTAVAMVVGIGGPLGALTSLDSVLVAALADVLVESGSRRLRAGPAPQHCLPVNAAAAWANANEV